MFSPLRKHKRFFLTVFYILGEFPVTRETIYARCPLDQADSDPGSKFCFVCNIVM